MCTLELCPIHCSAQCVQIHQCGEYCLPYWESVATDAVGSHYWLSSPTDAVGVLSVTHRCCGVTPLTERTLRCCGFTRCVPQMLWIHTRHCSWAASAIPHHVGDYRLPLGEGAPHRCCGAHYMQCVPQMLWELTTDAMCSQML